MRMKIKVIVFNQIFSNNLFAFLKLNKWFLKQNMSISKIDIFFISFLLSV